MDKASRRTQSLEVRVQAAELAANRPIPQHLNNGDELRYRRWLPSKSKQKPTYIGNFTKGLPHHNETGLVQNPADYQQFIKAINSADPADFRLTPLGPASAPVIHDCLSKQLAQCGVADESLWLSTVAKDKRALNLDRESEDFIAKPRAWESQSAGLLLDLQGPDALSVTMPPAPAIASDEAAAEMAEVYAMALLRDTHFSHFRDRSQGDVIDVKQEGEFCKQLIGVDEASERLSTLSWFANPDTSKLSGAEKARKRGNEHLEAQNRFRGVFIGDDKGPYLSQYLLLGNGGINGNDSNSGLEPASGYASYGAQRIDQRVRVATPCKDYMTTFEAWLDVQNGADLRGIELYEERAYRFPTTPRDMATYVHYDALYQAYLNACLIMLGDGTPFDPGLPFELDDVMDKQQGFASFGGPHILSLVTEVATRALKAVRYQKFNVHRRLRPEAMAARIDRRFCLKSSHKAYHAFEVGEEIAAKIESTDLLRFINEHNDNQNRAPDRASDAGAKKKSFLLPMAIPEGSPMHPCYGAGHATVAGACVTILKAFFDTGHQLRNKDGKPFAYEANSDGSKLVSLKLDEALTVEGELNKLAANISIGRNWAGVHYFSDYIESMRMGEQVALGLLEEQKLCYNENFQMNVPLFDGGVVQI